MKYFITLLLMPMLLSAQLKEDILEEGKFMYLPAERNDWEDKIVDDRSYIYHYTRWQLKVSEALKDESKTTSIFLYHKGQADAYKDILKFIENL
jgi:hypothetical protein